MHGGEEQRDGEKQTLLSREPAAELDSGILRDPPGSGPEPKVDS